MFNSTNNSAGCWDKTPKEHQEATNANKAQDAEIRQQGKEMLKTVVFVSGIKKSKHKM